MSDRSDDPLPLPLRTGVTVHYRERGTADGPAVVFVHGGGKDLTYWDRHLGAFSAHYRAVAYSRRYAPPNDNHAIVPHYSARVDADDLVALLDALAVRSAHLVGASIGGVAALFVAVEHPDRVQSLVLAEPPVLRWARDVPGGNELLTRFLEEAYEPAGASFRSGDSEAAMALLIDAFVGPGAFRGLPQRKRDRVMRGSRDWAAQTMSQDAFAELSREQVRRIGAPVLLLSGERTTPLHALIDDELERELPLCERLVVPDASHDMWADAPQVCRDAALRFLRHRGGTLRPVVE